MAGGRRAAGESAERGTQEPAAGPWNGIVRRLTAPVQALVDFLVEDRCVLCGGAPVRPPARERVGLTAVLRQPVHVALFRAVVIENHPICAGCASGFVPARRPGRLGRFDRSGGIRTITGAHFEPATPAPARAPRDIAVIAPFMTTDKPLKIIRLIKFSGYTALARPVAGAMGDAYRHACGRPAEGTVVLPVPIDAAARRSRGFNPAGTIAGHLAAEFHIPLLQCTLYKVRRTARQSLTGHAERASNVRSAFRCRGPAVEGRDVLLVDDLVTTGATAAACGVEIGAAGARSVTVLCFARAL